MIAEGSRKLGNIIFIIQVKNLDAIAIDFDRLQLFLTMV